MSVWPLLRGIIIKPVGKKEYSLEELLKGITTDNRHDEADFGRPVCPITTKIKGYPFEVTLEGSKKTSGVALADQVRSVEWQVRKIKVIDRLSTASVATILA